MDSIEAKAIPRCLENRQANAINNTPARYCVSAYCERCAALRQADGVPPNRPNAWMYEGDTWDEDTVELP